MIAKVIVWGAEPRRGAAPARGRIAEGPRSTACGPTVTSWSTCCATPSSSAATMHTTYLDSVDLGSAHSGGYDERGPGDGRARRCARRPRGDPPRSEGAEPHPHRLAQRLLGRARHDAWRTATRPSRSPGEGDAAVGVGAGRPGRARAARRAAHVRGHPHRCPDRRRLAAGSRVVRQAATVHRPVPTRSRPARCSRRCQAAWCRSARRSATR